ncbi:MAG: ompA [Cytophagaceae bacterium]|jgi:outer membrane protein OmpA-like peptidoglycan-associated protein|nr:ompA [Cytophagaceae bacterium]
MTKRIISFLLLSILTVSTYAQDIQWAYRVLEYSSQQGDVDFSSRQILGRPNVYPAQGENRNAWQPKDKSTQQFIKVGYRTPIIPKQILIVETNHPGSIEKVFVYDAEGKEFEITNYRNTTTSDGNRLLSIKPNDVKFYVLAVKIVLKSNSTIAGIDAIGISESAKVPKINKQKPNELVKANMVATKLSNNINSPYPEMGPLVSPDGKTLYFSRRGDPQAQGGKEDLEDIFYSEWNATTQSWGEAKNIGAPLNNDGPNFINSISPDGNTLLLGNSYFEDGTMEDGVSVSHRTKDGWSFPERLIIDKDVNINARANFFMSNSQKILLMSIEHKKDNVGNRDLYVSFRSDDGTWTKPTNLGNTLNTTGIEQAPFLASDDRTLYFASDGMNGYGGSDIYVTRRLDDTWTNWSTPENLGPIVNSSRDESYLSIPASGERIYFTSEGAKDGDDDILVLQLVKSLKPNAVTMISGRVLNSKTNETIPGVKIFFENLVTGAEVGIASSDPRNGTYQIVLPSKNRYGYLAEKEGFISVNDNIDLTYQNEYQQITRDLYLTPIEVGESITIKNIFFDFNKAVLRKESNLELNRLAKLLANNPNLKVEISGYTDSVGTKAYNDKLSQKRAEAVASYLTTKSATDASRISVKHYGENAPASTNSTAKGRQLNRRVEFKILAK